jgi:transposase
MDRRAVLAREYHKSASEAFDRATEYRAKRNRLVRELYLDGYGYQSVARMVGVSKSLVRNIIKDADSM